MNIMTKEEYILLYEKCVSGKATAKEQKLFEEYQDDYSSNFTFLDETHNQESLQRDKRIYKKLQHNIKGNKFRKLIGYQQPLAAAIFFCLISFGVYFFWPPSKNINTTSSVQIAPGSSKAILTLANGEQVLLDGRKSGVLTTQDNAIIRKESDGRIVYGTNSSNENNALSLQNTITIPRGGEYQLVLADGTKVWLNSESSLKFPVTFKGAERKVELTGEAYFEVAKDKTKAFTVSVKNTEVSVLGTHFNINAYRAVNTTLIEGVVKLSNKHHEVILKPGEYGEIQENNLYKVEPADIEAAIGWKDGYFVFHDESIKSIMGKVSRWYDVDVEYKSNVDHLKFYGKLSRFENVTELLNNIELTGTVRFKVVAAKENQKRRIIVMT